jgi:dimethylargininase
LVGGIGGLQHSGGGFLLACFEIAAGGLLVAAVIRELRGKHALHLARMSWVDLFAAAALLAEGFRLSLEGNHYVQYGYYAAAAMMAARGLFIGRLLERRRLVLDEGGLRVPSGPFRTLRARWSDLTSVELAGERITVETSSGKRRGIDLADMHNAGDVRDALVDAARRFAPGAIVRGLPAQAAAAAQLAGPAQASTHPRWVALTREVSPRIAEAALTFVTRQPIDVARAREQHRAYEAALVSLGATIERLPPLPDAPDGVFVEDAAVVLEEVAVITRPGAASRRPEIDSVAAALAAHRRVLRIEPPGTLDGGDVLLAGETLFVGRSRRTNGAGIEQLRALTASLGYRVEPVPVRGCLHLKSAAALIAPGMLLVNPAWIDSTPFQGMRLVEVDAAEPHGANALLLSGTVLYPAAHPLTRAKLETQGIRVQIVDLSELAKAEGAVTCCSLIVGVP